MIGNKILNELYSYHDRDTALNQLLEMLKFSDSRFINSLSNEVPDLSKLNDDEFHFVVIVSALVDYCYTEKGIKVPGWINSKKLRFSEPFFYQKRITELEKSELLLTSPNSFKQKNVYFDLHSLKRV